jgi:hypothetical protein
MVMLWCLIWKRKHVIHIECKCLQWLNAMTFSGMICLIPEFNSVYSIPSIQVQVDTMGYGTSQVQINYICTVIVLLEKLVVRL